ncbi:hypothetical protein GCM10027187_39730 [Streptosporangium sandarakinum]|uniref:DUF3168 domain-containing protein n=1 Tax=Streptosporangium sandarakinum TaxID=1260955 RepID=A0A852V980_9ACTN|nr:hypothetical protein [Streptosporangium sandarakinum]NYF44696.1 hypothetical protein [Streptosporangium sandarakinum]
MRSLADADPIPAALDLLAGSTRLAAELGGPGRVGAQHVPPYPRLRVRPTPGGSDNLLTGEAHVLVKLEALDSTDAPVGEWQLRQILYVALEELATLPALPYDDGQVVITDVASASGGGPVPEADGRGRYIATAAIHCHA